MIDNEQLIFEFDSHSQGRCEIYSHGPEIGNLSIVATREKTPQKAGALLRTSITGRLQCYERHPGGNGFRPFEISASYYDPKSFELVSLEISGIRLHESGNFIAHGITVRSKRR